MRMYLRYLVAVAAGVIALTFMLQAIQLDSLDTLDTEIEAEQEETEESETSGPKARPYRQDPVQMQNDELKAHLSLIELESQRAKEEAEKIVRTVPVPGPLPRASQDPYILSLSTYLAKWEGREGEACPDPDTYGAYYNRTYKEKLPINDSFDRFYDIIGSCDMYRESDGDILNDVIHDLRTLPIKDVDILKGGTQVKLLIRFENGKKAAFKPMRFGREYEVEPNHFYHSEYERHNAEIAAFHLDKVLGIRHAIPTTGRVFNLSSEIQAHADYALKKTFFVSPSANLCFESKCDYYCDTTHAICGRPFMKEASVQLFLPGMRIAKRLSKESPYRRTYRVGWLNPRDQWADWQRDSNYCDFVVKTKVEWAHGRKLLNLVEMHIFDFLTGFDFFDADNYPIFFDNGRAFGRPYWDDLDILLPLIQCCVIRPKLLKRLLSFYTGPESLSQALSASMATEPVAPILAAKHYPALQRRLVHILATVKMCIDKTGNPDDVIMYEYHNPNVDPDRSYEYETESRR